MLKSPLKTTLIITLGALSPLAIPAAQFIETNGVVVMEAEHYTAKVDPGNDHPFVLVPDDAPYTAGGTNAVFMNARGGRFLQVQPDDGGNKGNDVSLVGTAPY